MDSEAAARDSWASIGDGVSSGPSSGFSYASSGPASVQEAARRAPGFGAESGPIETEAARDPRTAAEVARVHRAGEGDPSSQTWLVTRVLPRVRRIARTFLRSPADADDAAQTSLLAILKSAPTYRGEAALEGWAGRIAVRTTLRLAAERKREQARSADDDALPEEAAPEEARSAEALPRELREYLDGLPEAQRTAVLLHHALDHSIDEIAETMDVSPDTVKSRLRLGLASLRKQIRQDIAVGRRRSS